MILQHSNATLAQGLSDIEAEKDVVRQQLAAERRRRALVEGPFSFEDTHRRIEDLLLSQGEIHWDEFLPDQQAGSQPDPAGLRWIHHSYEITDYRGDGCDVTFARRLTTRTTHNLTAPDRDATEVTSQRTASLSLAEAIDISLYGYHYLKVVTYAEPENGEPGLVARDIVFRGQIDVDGRPLEKFALTARTSEASMDGENDTATSLEIWFSHLQFLCRDALERDPV